MNEFESKILSALESVKELHPSASLLAAFSGGPDSCALLEAAAALCKEGRLTAPLAAVHINHNLRGEASKRDEEFARKFCEDRGIEYYSETADVSGRAEEKNESVETAARNIRLEIFSRLSRNKGFDCILTGHHAGDNCETVIHRLQRGTGFRGLCGIRQSRRVNGLLLVSPLLFAEKDEILEYCREKAIPYAVDSTNLTNDYRRNFIRNSLLPEIRKESPNICEKLCLLSEAAERLDESVCREAENCWHSTVIISEQDFVTVNRNEFNALAVLVKQEIARRILVQLGAGENKLTRDHYTRILERAGEAQSSKLQLPDEIYVFTNQDKIIFSLLKTEGLSGVKIESPGKFRFGVWQIEVRQEQFDKSKFERFLKEKPKGTTLFDAEKTALPITARQRQAGDRFIPFSLNSPQRVNKFLIRAKVNRMERSNAVVFQDKTSKIIWVAPYRTSEEVKITEKTKCIILIKLTRLQLGE
ncbi:tRNA(Ile)-lysidine synthase [Sedimentisphaera cyanobacteriorum]|uniref:tRNA(Ile)-lysidine synthase n=1 Tax=Sedimentisphaera cyanobacteriorum TaxID=1940790 RepID=A0A1Q2HM07_9BACT|nr:tRNA lysidine(34) synthetase TilS [Sedimentisphaera cyanobacteriorum]AQQ08488.1 tRNA(Ile)-lysidine synthase [Sedimentisphaera cyanobacteriorum]